MGYTLESSIQHIAQDPAGRAILDRFVPGLADNEFVRTTPGLRLGTMTKFVKDEAVVAALLAELEPLVEVAWGLGDDEPWPTPSADYEPDAAPASAAVTPPADACVYATAEVGLAGPAHGNPFLDVELTAEVSGPVGTHTVHGFYDGDGTYRVRFLPEAEGTYRLRTASNARSLDGIEVSVEVGPAASGAHGPVRVQGNSFVHADGTRALPLGTTCYAWTHQTTALQEQTLATLAEAPFTKLRMCVFPKSMVYNENEPELYPFVGGREGYDKRTFDPAFFAHLERRIAQLGELGIDADLILFHPYDRWGYATLGRQADDHYLRYVVARLAAFPNVWWSLANEYDLVAFKTVDDWHRLGRLVRELDPYGHPTSIHQCFDFFDHSADWVTHASTQRVDLYRTAEEVDAWRRRWGKPVQLDEVGYEGDLPFGWGNLTAEELVRRFWEAACRGGWCGHGETFLDPDDVIWWAKGGVLKGESPARIAFLRQVLADAPGDLEFRDDPMGPAGVVGDAYFLHYLSFMRPGVVDVRLAPGDWTLDVLDTWNMTVEPVDGTHSGGVQLALPARPYLAVRGRRAHASTDNQPEENR